MKYALFIGSKLGFEALNLLYKENLNIKHVFIEKEHGHEIEKYYLKSKKICERANINYTINAKNKDVINTIEKDHESLDYIMSFGYRRMISEDITSLAKIGALGTHFSPLPKYRGFAPLNWLLINGERETAVNLFYLDKEVDNGDIIARKNVHINYKDDINTLFEKCLKEFYNLLKEVIPSLEANDFKSLKQDNKEATYTCARSPEDGRINWSSTSYDTYNLVRALTHPFPGAYTTFEGEKLTIVSCEEFEEDNYVGRVPGRVIKVIKDKGIVVLCGTGSILIKEVKYYNSEEIVPVESIIKSVRDTLI